MNAIRNSNSAIIIMSQDYINSLWCVEEFEDCYVENMKDPAFKLFVILMQPADTLNVTNEYIKSFFTKKTYLERDDPDLFKKIAEYLVWIKQPKGEQPPSEEDTNSVMDPLLNQNMTEAGDGIMMAEDKEYIKLRKLPIHKRTDVHRSDDNDDDDDDDDDQFLVETYTGPTRLIRSHSSARFCFELSGNSNYILHCNSNYVQNFELEINSI